MQQSNLINRRCSAPYVTIVTVPMPWMCDRYGVTTTAAGKWDETLVRDTPPALRHLTPSMLDALQCAVNTPAPPAAVRAWCEQLLRTCEVRQRELLQRFRTIAGGTRAAQTLAIRTAILFCAAAERFGDVRFLNVALKLRDQTWLRPRYMWGRHNRAIAEVMTLWAVLQALTIDQVRAVAGSTNPTATRVAEQVVRIESELTAEPLDRPATVVILSPNPRSLATLAVAELLSQQGVRVGAIVVRRIFNVSRLRDEWLRDGLTWVIRKFLEKFLFRGVERATPDGDSMAALADRLQVAHLTTTTWCLRHGSTHLSCDTLNDSDVHQLLGQVQPALVVFTGGGILREETLRLSGAGVVNCHGGILPHYRGLDLDKWPLLENNPTLVGIATHFMSARVDEGDLLLQMRFDARPCRSLHEVGRLAEVSYVRLLVTSVVGYLAGRLPRTPQFPTDGRQYFYMHPELVRIAESRLGLAT